MGLGSGIRKKPIPDPGVKKAPDPGSGSSTLPKGIRVKLGWRIRLLIWIHVHFGLEDPDPDADPCSIRVGGSGFQKGSVIN